MDDGEARRLADQSRVGAVAGAEHRPHAVAAALLLDYRAEDEIALGCGTEARNDFGSEQVCRKAALHVTGAAAPDAPLGDLAAPWIVGPGRVRIDGHDVNVAAQVQRAPASAATPHPDHRAATVVCERRITGSR